MTHVSNVIDKIAEQQEKLKENINEGIPEVGIFWLINKEVLQDSVPWSESSGIVMDGRYLNGPSDHLSFWKRAKRWLPEASVRDHVFYPRGRVMRDAEENVFIVVTTSAIVDNPRAKVAIRRSFSLPDGTRFESHSHYENFTADPWPVIESAASAEAALKSLDR